MPRFLSLVAFAALTLLSWGSPAHSAQPLSAAQTESVNKLIHDYILAHPEIVIEALQEGQQKADAAKAAADESTLAQHQKELLHDPDSPVLGNPNGTVTLVEFFDYRCPYCKSSAPSVTELIRGDPTLRVVMKELPVLGPESVFASRVALAVVRHGKYAAFHDALLANKGTLDNDKTLEIARLFGLNPAKLQKESADPAITANIQADLDLSRTLGIDGTPTFVVGNTIIPGVVSLDDLKQAVADARAR